MAIQTTIFYCNGILNTEDDANQTKNNISSMIQELIKKDNIKQISADISLKNKVTVELYFNDSTPKNKFFIGIGLASMGLVGVATFGILLGKTWEKKESRDRFSWGGISFFCCITCALSLHLQHDSKTQRRIS